MWQYFEFTLNRNHFPICWVHVCTVIVLKRYIIFTSCEREAVNEDGIQKPYCHFDQIPSLFYFIASLNIFLLPDCFGHWQLWGLMAAFARSAIGLQILATGPLFASQQDVGPTWRRHSNLQKKRWIMGLKIELCTCRRTFSSMDTLGSSDRTKCHMKGMLWPQSWLKQLVAFKTQRGITEVFHKELPVQTWVMVLKFWIKF